MPKKGSTKKNNLNNKNDDSTSRKGWDEKNDFENDNDNDNKPNKCLTNQILKQQKINYKKTVNNFLQSDGFIVLSY